MRALTKAELSYLSGANGLPELFLVAVGTALGTLGGYCASTKKDRSPLLQGTTIGFFGGMFGVVLYIASEWLMHATLRYSRLNR